jgi:hypothetical protein
VLTAAITGAIAWILSLFGIKPGPYLVVVAGVVKVIIVLCGVLLGAKAMKKRKQAKEAREAASAQPSPPAAPSVGPTDQT